MTMADWHGNLYIADKDGHAVRQVTSAGVIVTLAGTNEAGYNGDGLAQSVMLNQPNGLYTFPNGTTYILDLGNSMIRKLSLDGMITTVVEDPFGLAIGRGLWVSPDEQTIYYSAGTEVRCWTPVTGVSVYADGFVELGNLTVDPADGQVVVTDRGGHGVYKLFADGSRQRIAGNESTVGGGSGFPALATGLKEVRGIQYYPDGGYFLATHDGGQIWFVDDKDVVHLLIDGDDNDTHWGDGLPLSSPGRKISEPRAVTLAPNGDLIVTEHDGGYIRYAAAVRPWAMGDFDQDHQLSQSDIDQLTAAVRSGLHPQTLDLTFDSLVTADDRMVWIDDLKRSYLGDADLDGEFNSRDIVAVFQTGEYEDTIAGNSLWADGDWNGDGEFDTQDFVVAFSVGAYEQGPRRNGAWMVPEPSACATGLGPLALLLAGRFRRMRAGFRLDGRLS
jgi:hypothetical protein